MSTPNTSFILEYCDQFPALEELDVVFAPSFLATTTPFNEIVTVNYGSAPLGIVSGMVRCTISTHEPAVTDRIGVSSAPSQSPSVYYAIPLAMGL